MQNYSYFVCFHNKLRRIYTITDYLILPFPLKLQEFYNIQSKKNSLETHNLYIKIIK